jgi:hypothetical protein
MYLLLEYRTDKRYLDDPGLRLLKDDRLLFNDEVEFLIKQGFTIVRYYPSYGWAVIEESEMDIPHLKIAPNVIECSKNCFPCIIRGINCPKFNECLVNR